MRTLIITGGSSGIGQAAADLFAAKGYKVYELSRHGEDRAGVTHIDCDVTSPDDCRNAAAKVATEAGKIDVLISNAGMGISGAIEFTDINEAKRQFDVNFFGAVNIAQAVLPYMRNEHDGKIIFVSSLAATFPIPYQAFYSASKSAINAMAMAMRNEVREFGIKVCCLLPGDVKTGFTGSRTKSNAGSDVYTRMNKAVKTMEHDEQNGITPERMAKKLLALASQDSPCIFSTVGLQYHLFVMLNKILPATLANRVIGMMY
ncbi:MAG: SDR family oxidoreductase [Bacteroidaceae bacterium]|nr:SDR family oxidoreductase [Bacteroidaceae bacterium]